MEHYKNLSLEDLSEEINGVIYKEQWKVVEGYPDYMISSFGRVKSYKKGLWGNNPISIKRQYLDNHGYPVVNFFVNGRTLHQKPHRLVAAAFIENPCNKLTVNHKLGVKTNNMVHQLEWATYSEQNKHIYQVLKRKHPCTGKFGSDSKLAKKVFCETNGKIYGSTRDAAKDLDLYPQNISHVLTGRYKHTGGYIFKYF